MWRPKGGYSAEIVKEHRLSSGDNLSFYLFFKLICFYKQSMAHKKECFHEIFAIWISSAVISKTLVIT